MTHVTRVVSTLAVLVMAHPLPALSQSTASLGGIITDSRGGSQARAVVTVRSTSGGLKHQTIADDQGRYSLSGLPDGESRVCVHALSAEQLDPCEWSTDSIRLSPGEDRTLPIQLQRGHSIQVRINDPAGLVVHGVRERSLGHVMVGLWGADGLFKAMPIKSTDSEGETFELFIPDTAPLSLSVSSSDLLIQNPEKKGAEGQRLARVELRPGTTARGLFVFAVSPRKQLPGDLGGAKK